jgi:hypothetical protein
MNFRTYGTLARGLEAAVAIRYRRRNDDPQANARYGRKHLHRDLLAGANLSFRLSHKGAAFQRNQNSMSRQAAADSSGQNLTYTQRKLKRRQRCSLRKLRLTVENMADLFR